MSLDMQVLVVGGGLAGLSAALHLARRGRRVVLVERQTRLGGRCGQFVLDGHRFTIGCTTADARIARDLDELGAPVAFERCHNVVALGEHTLELRPSMRLLRHLPAIVRLARRVRRAAPDATLGDLYPPDERDDLGFHLAALLALATGASPQHLLRMPSATVAPIGGAQAIVDAMLARLAAHYVTLWTDTTVGDITARGRRWHATSSRGDIVANTVITTAAPSAEGLSVAQLLWETTTSAPFVRGRTLLVSPANLDAWMTTLHAGAWPETYGFHIARDVVAQSSVTWTGHVLVPRGTDQLSDAQRTAIFTRIEAASAASRASPPPSATVAASIHWSTERSTASARRSRPRRSARQSSRPAATRWATASAHAA